MKCLALFFLLALAGALRAEEIPIAGKSWSIRFDGPSFENAEEATRGDDYAYRAQAGRTKITLFVESPPAGTPAGATNKQCYEHYWTLAKEDPAIVLASITVLPTPRYHRVEFTTKAEKDGKEILSRNVNYYFVHDGKWVELHFSFDSPNVFDSDAIRRIDLSLAYEKPAKEQ